MRQCRNCFGLSLEPRAGGFVTGQMRRQHFQRDLAIESRVARPEHLAHPACANRRDDLIGPETGAGSQGQVVVDYTGRTARRTDTLV